MLKTVLVGVVSAATLTLASCSSEGIKGDLATSGSAASIPNAGFLSDYSKLKPVDGMSGTYRYIDSITNLRPYHKVAIDPVQVIVDQNAEYKGLPPDVIKRMTDLVHTEFVGALLSGYQIVNTPGPDVLRVRLAITGVQAVRPDVKVTDFVPVKVVFNIARSASGAAPHVAEMSGEMEIVDPSGRAVGAAVSTRKSDKTLAQGERITWKDMQAIAAVWAKNLRQQLDYQRGYAAR